MNNVQRSRVFVGLAALALTVAGLTATPGAAAESGPNRGKADQAPSAGAHCTLSVKTRATQCFDTFRESIAHATGGRVTDAKLSGPASVDSKTAAQLDEGGFGAQSVVLVVQYYWENFRDSPTLTSYGAVGCTAPLEPEHVLAPLPVHFLPTEILNWNNNIRSFQGFNGCWQRMWDNPDCTGLLLDYASSSADLGAARDRAECIEFS